MGSVGNHNLEGSMAEFLCRESECFLWQFIYAVPATNQWKFQGKLSTDTRTHCERCRRGLKEDIGHCLWECHKAERVWRWIVSIINITLVNRKHAQLSVTQALVGEPLQQHVPIKWWCSLRVAALWQTWLARNVEVIPKDSFRATQTKIWQQVKTEMLNEWRRCQHQVKEGVFSE